MSLNPSATRFARWSRPDALLALATYLLVTATCLTVCETRVTRPVETRAGDTDEDLFRKVVARVHAGETTYDAFEHVFREYDYPVRSVFNYRLPLLTWVLGQLPAPLWGKVLFALLAGMTALSAFAAMQDDIGTLRSGLGVLLMLGALSYGFLGDLYLYTEVWAGALIALSVFSYALGRRSVGFVSGMLALFVRELALPYALVALIVAWRQGRRREAMAWGIGLLLFGVALAAHVREAAPRIPPGGTLVNAHAWVHCGGVAFLLAASGMNLFLLASPPWVTAIILPLALLGLAGGTSELSTRIGLLIASYLAAFSVIGGIFNAYWGLLYAPLLPLGLVAAPSALRDLALTGLQYRKAFAQTQGPSRKGG